MQSKWPKTFPPLTPEQVTISADFMELWHRELPRKYQFVDAFGHSFVRRASPPGFVRTLEIGAGLGEHLEYERLTPEQERGYHALDLRENMIAELVRRRPAIQGMVGDCQRRLDFPDGHFDRVIAIHVLEHLPDLPAAVREMRRVIAPGGMLLAVIPCEGGLAYSLARRISAQRLFEARYKQSYSWFIEREHVNLPAEILEELSACFTVRRRSFFPLPLPFVFCNLCIGLALKPL